MASYAVDTVSGSDGWNGSAGSPWRTLNYGVTQLAANDTLYIRGGSSYAARRIITEGVLVSSASCANGSASSPIVVTTYPGEYIEHRTANGTECWEINARTYWNITGPSSVAASSGSPNYLINLNDNTNLSYGWRALNAATGCSATRLHITNGGGYNPLVRIERSGSCAISYCRIWDNGPVPGVDSHGVYITGDASSQANNNYVGYCTIYDVTDCVQINGTTNELGGGVADPIVEYCELYTTIGGASEDGIDDKVGVRSIFRYNTLYGFRFCDGTSGGTSSDGGGIVIHGDAYDTQIYGNTFYNMSGAAIKTQVVAGTSVAIYRNLVYDMFYESVNAERYHFYVFQPTAVHYIYNNTFVGKHTNGTSSGSYAFRINDNCQVELRNNIFYSTGSPRLGGSLAYNYDHNNWYSCLSASSGSNDVYTDPLFSSSAADDYRITFSSPCKDAGSNIGAPYSTGSMGAGLDIGYYEYGAAESLSFSGFPSIGTAGTPVSAFDVRGLTYDSQTATAYSGSVTVSLLTGSGSISGTLTVVASSGTATFSNVTFSTAGSATLLASGT